jgi:hypothetical protein
MTSITRPQFSFTNRPTGYYTYAYLREDGRPFYVGKGQGSRAWDRHGSAKKPWSPPSNDRILFLKWDLSEDQALAHEIYLIALYGNAFKAGGWLTLNFTDGGEGTSGYVYTDELRGVRAEQLRGNSYGANVVWTEDLRAKLSAATVGKKKTKTEAVEKRHDSLHLRHHWRHSEMGDRYASASEMAREVGVRTTGFSRARRGKHSQAHGWQCLDPIKTFEAANVDHVSRIGKAAETRTAKNAAQLGMPVEEYRALPYFKRSQLRKERGLTEAA